MKSPGRVAFRIGSSASACGHANCYPHRKKLGEMGSPTSAVTTTTPVTTAPAPVAAAIAAAPVTPSVGAARIGPRGSLAAIVISADEVVAPLVRGCGRFGGWIRRGIAVSGATVVTRELVVKPVASESSAKSSEHAREETAAGSSISAAISWSVTGARPHPGLRHSAHAHRRGVPSPGPAEDPAQDSEEQQHSENSQANSEESSQPEFPTLRRSSAVDGNPCNGALSIRGRRGRGECIVKELRRLDQALIKPTELELAG